MPKGETLAVVQTTYFSSRHYWDSQGILRPQNRYQKWELQRYVEHGLTSRLTIGGTAAMQYVSQSGKENTGLADPEFFLRTTLLSIDGHVLSIQPLMKLPSRFRYNDSTTRGGSKSTDLELSLLYGYNPHLFSARDYFDLRIGYRQRNHGLKSQYRADIVLGLSPWEHWQFIHAMRGISASSVSDHTPYNQTGDIDYHLLKNEFTVNYDFSGGQAVHATYSRHVAGLQTGDGSALTLGYAVRF